MQRSSESTNFKPCCSAYLSSGPRISRNNNWRVACDPKSWIGFDGALCGECAALVKVRDNGGTCSDFRALQGLSCSSALDDSRNQCNLDAPCEGCDHNFGSTTGDICKCNTNSVAPPTLATSLSPTLSQATQSTPPVVACDRESWIGYECTGSVRHWSTSETKAVLARTSSVYRDLPVLQLGTTKITTGTA